MPEIGHFHRLQSLISGLADSGIKVNVFTHRKFELQIKDAGGVFFDLFSKYSLEQADNTSFPIPCRFVSFAAAYARQICRDVERTRPSLLIHDSFAVIGQVVATLLSIPRAKVKDAFVTGVKNKRGLEMVKAIIVVRQTCTVNDIIAFCKEHLADYKIPRIVEFMDTIPTDVMGKVIRSQIE